MIMPLVLGFTSWGHLGGPVELVEYPTLGFGSGPDLRVVKSSMGLWLSGEPPSPFLCPPPNKQVKPLQINTKLKGCAKPTIKREVTAAGLLERNV